MDDIQTVFRIYIYNAVALAMSYDAIYYKQSEISAKN